MASSSKYMENSIKYAKEHYKRVPLDLTFEFYEKAKSHASGNGEPLNVFIKRAIQETIDRENA